MSSLTEQFSAVTKSQLEAQFKFFNTFANTAVSSAEKLLALNINATKASVEKSSAAARKLLDAKGPQELFGTAPAQASGFDNLMAYGRQLVSIATAAQTELMQTAQSNFQQVRDVAKNSPLASVTPFATGGATASQTASQPAKEAPTRPAPPPPLALIGPEVTAAVESAAESASESAADSTAQSSANPASQTAAKSALSSNLASASTAASQSASAVYGSAAKAGEAVAKAGEAAVSTMAAAVSAAVATPAPEPLIAEAAAASAALSNEPVAAPAPAPAAKSPAKPKPAAAPIEPEPEQPVAVKTHVKPSAAKTAFPAQEPAHKTVELAPETKSAKSKEAPSKAKPASGKHHEQVSAKGKK